MFLWIRKRSIKFWKLSGSIRMAGERMYNGVIYVRCNPGQESVSCYSNHREFCGGLLRCTSLSHISFWSSVPSSKSELLKLVGEMKHG